MASSDPISKRRLSRHKRALRVRRHLRACGDRPRLVVNKSNKHIYVQIIDDEKAHTVVGLGTMSKEFHNTPLSTKSMDAARELGKRVAEAAIAKGIKKVMFDRGCFHYHGLVRQVSEAAREGGLEF